MIQSDVSSSEVSSSMESKDYLLNCLNEENQNISYDVNDWAVAFNEDSSSCNEYSIDDVEVNPLEIYDDYSAFFESAKVAKDALISDTISISSSFKTNKSNNESKVSSPCTNTVSSLDSARTFTSENDINVEMDVPICKCTSSESPNGICSIKGELHQQSKNLSKKGNLSVLQIKNKNDIDVPFDREKGNSTENSVSKSDCPSLQISHDECCINEGGHQQLPQRSRVTPFHSEEESENERSFYQALENSRKKAKEDRNILIGIERLRWIIAETALTHMQCFYRRRFATKRLIARLYKHIKLRVFLVWINFLDSCDKERATRMLKMKLMIIFKRNYQEATKLWKEYLHRYHLVNLVMSLISFTTIGCFRETFQIWGNRTRWITLFTKKIEVMAASILRRCSFYCWKLFVIKICRLNAIATKIAQKQFFSKWQSFVLYDQKCNWALETIQRFARGRLVRCKINRLMSMDFTYYSDHDKNDFFEENEFDFEFLEKENTLNENMDSFITSYSKNSFRKSELKKEKSPQNFTSQQYINSDNGSIVKQNSTTNERPEVESEWSGTISKVYLIITIINIYLEYI